MIEKLLNWVEVKDDKNMVKNFKELYDVYGNNFQKIEAVRTKVDDTICTFYVGSITEQTISGQKTTYTGLGYEHNHGYIKLGKPQRSIKYVEIGEEKKLDLRDLELICKDCSEILYKYTKPSEIKK